MKKFIFLVVIFFIGFDFVSAKDFFVVDKNNDERYFFKEMVDNDEPYFFLTPSSNYNFNMYQYYEVKFERNYFPKYLDEVLSYDSYFYHSYILFQLYLLNYLYDMNLEVINPVDEELFLQDKVRFDNLMRTYEDGFWYQTPRVRQEANSEKEYHSDYLPLFELKRYDKEVRYVDDYTIKIKTEAPSIDTYTFVRKDNGRNIRLLTDGEYYIISYGKPPVRYYEMQVNSYLEELKIVSQDENGGPIDNVCYNIYHNKELLTNECTKNGEVTFYLPVDKYQIIRENSIRGYDNDTESYEVYLSKYTIVTDKFYLIKDDVIDEETKIELPFDDYKNEINMISKELSIVGKNLNDLIITQKNAPKPVIYNNSDITKEDILGIYEGKNEPLTYTYNYYQSMKQENDKIKQKFDFKYILYVGYVLIFMMIIFLIKSIKNYKRAKKS